MNKLLAFFALAALTVTASASQLRIQSPPANTPYLGLLADGSLLTTAPAGSVRFAAGVFDDTFELSLPLDNWFAHFTPALLSDASWGVSGPGRGRFNNVSLESSDAFDGRQGFIFGTYLVDSVINEWVVFTNPAWIFPNFDPLDLPGNADVWNVGSAGTTTLVGSLLNATPSGNSGFQFAIPAAVAVPEPSSYGIMAGVGCFLAVAIRRRFFRS